MSFTDYGSISRSPRLKPDFAWTEEKIERLKVLWAADTSGGKIADELGCTRNAAIGKAHRLGLAGRTARITGIGNGSAQAAVVERVRARRAKRARPTPERQTAFRPKPKPEIELPADPASINQVAAGFHAAIPLGQRRTLLQLTKDTCRWPVGDPQAADFFFCGGPPIEGVPYCGFHCRVAYQPATPRRPQP